MKNYDAEIEHHAQKREAYLSLADAETKWLEAHNPTRTVAEDTFFLEYDNKTGDKLKDYQIAIPNKNDPSRFVAALKELKRVGATISNRYFGDGYKFEYWSFHGAIFRQQPKER